MIGQIVVAILLIGCSAAEAPPTPRIGSRLLEALGSPFLPDPQLQVSAGCRAQSEYFVQELSRYSIWALKMYDASTKVPSSLITGNVWQLGGFDECINVGHESRSDLGVIHGKHCSVTVQLENPIKQNSSDTGELSKLLAAAFEASALAGRRNKTWASWALCVPSACSAKDVEDTVRWRLASAVSPESLPPISVATEACQVASDSPAAQPLRTSEVAFILALMVIVALLALGTLYDLYRFKSSEPRNRSGTVWENLIVAFSVRRSGKTLFSPTSPNGSLDCLHGLKVLSTCWVVLLHTGFLKATAPTLNSAVIPRLGDFVVNMIVMNSTLSTDTFFLVSGILLARGFLQKKERFNPIMFYWHRYIRLAPVLMAMVWFYATFLYRLGWGPLWNSTVGPERDNCIESWWTNLLFVNNYLNHSAPCMLHTWYLAVDMQLVLLSPLILIPLKKAPRFGACLLTLVIFAAIASPFTITFIENLSGSMLYTVDQQKTAAVFVNIYVNVYTRAGPYLIGIALAFYMHHYKNTKHLPKTINILAWVTAGVCCLSALFGAFGFYQVGHTYNVLEAASYAGLHRSAWALGVAWIVFACVRGYGGLVNRFLSWSAFVPLSRLSFGVYLCHYMFLLINNGTTRTAGFFSQYEVIKGCLPILMISTGFSVILFVMIEHPTMCLDKILTGLVSGKKGATVSSPLTQTSNPVVADTDLEGGRRRGYDNEGYEKSTEDDSGNSPSGWTTGTGTRTR